MKLPKTGVDTSLVVRTDFSDDATWESICRSLLEADLEMCGPNCRAFQFLNDRKWEGMTAKQIAGFALDDDDPTFAFLVDHQTGKIEGEQSIVVVDFDAEPGRSFRVTLHEVISIHASLSLANMDFEDYADNVDPDGVFRGF